MPVVASTTRAPAVTSTIATRAVTNATTAQASTPSSPFLASALGPFAGSFLGTTLSHLLFRRHKPSPSRSNFEDSNTAKQSNEPTPQQPTPSTPQGKTHPCFRDSFHVILFFVSRGNRDGALQTILPHLENVYGRKSQTPARVPVGHGHAQQLQNESRAHVEKFIPIHFNS